MTVIVIITIFKRKYFQRSESFTKNIRGCGEIHVQKITCPQMPQKWLFLPLFFHALTTAILSCLAVLSKSACKKLRTRLLALSWELPKLTISLLNLLLFIGSPLTHECSTNSLLCGTAAYTLALLSTWLNSWKFTNQPANCALLLTLPFFVFPLCPGTLFQS